MSLNCKFLALRAGLFAVAFQLVLEFVQFAGTVGHVLFHLVEVDEPVLQHDPFAEIPAVQVHAQDRFIEVLQFAEGEFFGQEIEDDGVFHYFFPQALQADIQDHFVVEGHLVDIIHIMPVQVGLAGGQLVGFDVHQGKIGGSDDPARRVPVDLTEGVDLFHIDVVQAGPLPQYPVGRLLEVLLGLYEIADDRPESCIFFEIGFKDKDLQLLFVITKDHTVDGKGDVEKFAVCALFDFSVL